LEKNSVVMLLFVLTEAEQPDAGMMTTEGLESRS
jgi:hypothetical protein